MLNAKCMIQCLIATVGIWIYLSMVFSYRSVSDSDCYQQAGRSPRRTEPGAWCSCIWDACIVYCMCHALVARLEIVTRTRAAHCAEPSGRGMICERILEIFTLLQGLDIFPTPRNTTKCITMFMMPARTNLLALSFMK